MQDDNDPVESGRGPKGGDGPVDHPPPGERLPLLGLVAPGAAAAACGDDDGGIGHGN